MAETNRVLFGLSNVHYALWDEKSKKYGTPKAIKGAVSMSISREGDSSIFYADNVPYVSFQTNGGYSGDLNVAVVEDEVLIDLLGWEKDDHGMLIEDASAVAPTFALMYEVSSNTEPQRFVFYNCSVSRPENEANTKTDSTEPDTQTLNISMITRNFPYGSGTVDAVKGSITRSEENKTTYEGFMNEVLLPSMAAA